VEEKEGPQVVGEPVSMRTRISATAGHISPSRQRRAATSRKLVSLTRIICCISRSRVTPRDMTPERIPKATKSEHFCLRVGRP
jgi:hypothetical protein